ncbi:MAG: methionyl-tRNA formyltransferase [Candidatus Omnitrophica bacterium]|nr:methionyl-tRNA formyltransferase [Candidatus Omnitrophota bacterium]
MNIVFFGSDAFAVPALKGLIASPHKVLCVVTQPDRKKGRGLHLEGTAVKQAALEAGLKLYHPDKVNSIETIGFLKGIAADLFVVIAYGQILSESILALPKIFCINVHASLLPELRGAAPINWAIINGDAKSGVTVMKLVAKMDAGPVALKKEIAIEDKDNALSLGEKLARLAQEGLLETLELIEKNNYKLEGQDERLATYAPKLKKEDGAIDWNGSALRINNQIRGLFDWPGAFTYYKGKLLKIYQARVTEPWSELKGKVPGEIITADKSGIVVACQDKWLAIEELQIAGKRRMAAGEFVAGHKIKAGERFSKK